MLKISEKSNFGKTAIFCKNLPDILKDACQVKKILRRFSRAARAKVKRTSKKLWYKMFSGVFKSRRCFCSAVCIGTQKVNAQNSKICRFIKVWQIQKDSGNRKELYRDGCEKRAKQTEQKAAGNWTGRNITEGQKNNQAGHLIFSSSPGCCCVNQFLIMKERV